MSRFSLAFRSFFAILSEGKVPADLAQVMGYVPDVPVAPPPPPPPPAPTVKTTDGALQMLGILQRDSRLIDFLMEDISLYQDDQVGAAVRSLHEQCRDTVQRYVTLAPVIDGVEGTNTRLDAKLAGDPTKVKLLGNVPASGKASQGILRHKGWRVEKVNLPPVTPALNVQVLAPAEVEVE